MARDLFDVWYFLKAGFPIQDALILDRTGKKAGTYLTSLTAFIEKTYTPRNVLQGLGDALDEKQKAWAKDHLVSETLQEINELLEKTGQPKKYQAPERCKKSRAAKVSQIRGGPRGVS